MKVALLGLLGWCGSALAADFYVAPNGSDAAPGTLAAPFATVMRGQEAARAGDTVHLRGGTYRMQEGQIARREEIFAYVIALSKSGEPERPITYRAYQGERPVFDFSQVKPAGLRVHAFSVSGSWLHLQGIEVMGVQVTGSDETQSICFESNGSHNVFEHLAMHDGQAIGLYHVRGSDNLFLNCDAWSNWDFTSGDKKGGNVDGFGAHPSRGSTGNVFQGCRAWNNSDDGFDCINAWEAVVFDHCWAFQNGLAADGRRLADGNGFKAGGYGVNPQPGKVPTVVPRHVIRFCMAVSNAANGFYANHHPGGSDWLQNTAWHNSRNFNLLGRLMETHTDVDGYGHKLRNNLAFQARNREEVAQLDRGKSDSANNSFEMNLRLSSRDFASLDERELVRPRQANGNLPEVRLLRPVRSSAFLNKGVDLGFPFQGKAPDLGAWELAP